jgi:hypothetical protein
METPMRPATIRQIQQHSRARQHILAASVGRIHVGDVVGRGRAARGIHCRISPVQRTDYSTRAALSRPRRSISFC